MLGIRKRGSAMYPSEGPSEVVENAPELKKQKRQSGTVEPLGDDASSTETTESPGLISSGPSTPADEVSVKPIDKGKSIDKGERVGEDKGKSLDESLGPIAELEQLKKELATKNEIIARQEKTINAVKDVMQCDICYDSVSPYVLSCGHVACYKCLMQWWTTGADRGPALERWQPNGPSDDESEGEIENSPSPAAAALPPADAVNSNAEGGPSQTGDIPGDAVEEEEEEDIPKAIHREKQCALCRTVIRTAPVQVYMLNKLHTIFGPPPKFKKNPWRGVFPSDKELKEIRSRVDVPLPDEIYDEEELADFIPPALHHPPDDHTVVVPMEHAVRDHEDNVIRCALCLHELWHGHCTNTACAVTYENDSDDSRSESGSDTGPGGLNPHDDNPDFDNPDDDNDDDNPDWVVRGEAAPEEGDDSYESSFIDDTDGPQNGGPEPSASDQVQDDVALHIQGSESHHETVIDLASDDDDAPGPSNRRRGRRQVTRILSEPEPDSDASSVHMTPRNSRRRARRLQEEVIHSASVSEDDVEGVIGSSNESRDSSNRENTSRMSTRRRAESPDSDGYNGEYIPYVWEEEDSGDEAGPSEEGDIHLSANFQGESDAGSYVY